MTATLVRAARDTSSTEVSGVAVMLTGVLPEGSTAGFAAVWASENDQRLVLLEASPDGGTGRPTVRTRRIARMIAQSHPDVPQSIRVVPASGPDVLAAAPHGVSCLVAANPFPARPDLWRPIVAPHCPIVLVPADALPPDSRAPVLLLLDRSSPDVSTVAFAFAYAHRVRRSVRALIVGDGPEPPAVLRTLGLVAGCYPRVPFDVVGHVTGDVTGLPALASDAALVVVGVAAGETPSVACGWDLAEVISTVGRPIALLEMSVARRP